MADIFNVNQYKSENVRLTLKPEQKSMITAKMYQACRTMEKRNTKTYKNIWVKAMAAVLAIVMVAGVGYIGFGTLDKSENWFMLSVDAATPTADEYIAYSTEDEVGPTEDNNSEINGFTKNAMTGFFMESETDVITKDGYKDYFAYYHMENFGIKGTNVKSVEFKSEKKGIYFVLTPTDNNVDYLSNTNEIDGALDKYKERYTLNNSQYTFDELRGQAPYLLWPCDGFEYENGTVSTGEEYNILPVNHIDIVLESDHSDTEIAAWVKEMNEINNLNEKEGYGKYSELERKVQEKMLRNAKITVTVTYEDGKTETQDINLAYKGNRYIAFDIAK